MIVGSVTVNLDHTQLADVVTKALIEEYFSLAISVDDLRSQNTMKALEPFEHEDLMNDLKFMSHIDGVLSLYMEPETYDNWRRTNKRYVELYDYKEGTKAK